MNAAIQFLNMGEVIAGIKKRQAKLDSIPKVARQMGVLATNEIHPLTRKKTGHWDSTIHAEVKQLKSFVWELWVGSRGAFAATGYNYGARQERLNHPIEIGWNKAQPDLKAHWMKMMHGIIIGKVTVSESFEFDTMGGF